jgi:hypothetical protein
VKLAAQVLATALAAYATPDSTRAAQYGFVVGGGIGAATWGVGPNGDVFGVTDTPT